MPGDHGGADDQSEEEPGHLDRALVQQVADHRREHDDGGEDADTEWDEKRPFHRLQLLDRPFAVRSDQPPERGRSLADRVDQPLVDPDDQGDGAARDAGDDVGGAHEEAADELGNDLCEHRSRIDAALCVRAHGHFGRDGA